MPLFSNKFSPKRTTPRKAEVSILNREEETKGVNVNVDEPIRIKIGDQQAVFDKGQWIPESGSVSGTHKENLKLKKCVQKLEEENNVLKLKFEILLDMLTQATAESHLHEKEIEQLRHKVEEMSTTNMRRL